ncbi:exocyst complex component exo84 [Oleoguttula sp. CCFEE 5521]
MSEDKKGLSLRRKKTTARPTISAPRQIQPRDRSEDSRWDAQTTSSVTPSLHGGASADKTSDLVKRRYSTRFAHGIPQDGAPPIPAMPSLPSQYARAQSRGDSRSPSRDGRSMSRGRTGLMVDARALQDPNMQADKYVQSILADASESDIHAYQNELANLKAHASADLQHNVYQNRTQFIKISKEADKLKSEMRTLRTLMSDLTGALGHATSAGGADVTGVSAQSLADRKRANRSSVADLEAMWTSHLQTLWKRVEGSQKYLPALPGRHIIMESQRWVELNAATWKPRRRVAIVLLNDHLLIASEKKRNDLAPGQGTPGASPRNNRQSVSTQTPRNPNKDNEAIKNALNVRAGNESLTYATSDSAEKAGILVAFRKAQEDMRKRTAAEHGEREAQLNSLALLTGRDPRSLKKAAAAASTDPALAQDIGPNRSNSILLDVEGRQQSIRAVESSLDSLDIDIALQRFDAPISRVEKLRNLGRGIKGNAVAQEIILNKVNSRATRLANAIVRQLLQTSAGLERTKENTSWLLCLGYADLARTTYLSSRTEAIRLRTRSVPFTGALVQYLHSLAFITFTMLVHTFKTYQASFPTSAGSAVVAWGKERVEEFDAVLGRQVGAVEEGGEVWKECLDRVRGRAEVLGEVGVDFRGLIGRGLEDGEVGKGLEANGAKAVGLGVQT